MFEQLKEAVSQASKWKCKIVCSGYTAFDSTHLQDVDICQFIAPVRNPSACSPAVLKLSDLSSWNGSQFQFDPSKFKGIESRQAIKNYLVDACKNAGFKVDPDIKLRKCTGQTKKPPAKSCEIIFKCAHNRKSITEMLMKKETKKEEAEHKVKRVRFHRRPINPEDKCPFQFVIHCSRSDEHWYLSLQKGLCQNDVPFHKGHHQVNSLHILPSLSSLNDDAISTIMSLHESNMTPSAIAAIITKRYGQNTKIYSASQMSHIISKQLAEDLCENYASMSSAEQLLYKFDTLALSDASLQYVALIHSVQDGYKIKLPHGRPAISQNQDFSIDQIRNAMRVNNNQDVLLAIAWTTSYEVQMLKKFPELITFDVTEKTNNQKRGLFLGTGLDGNGQLYPCLHVFMPNSQIGSYGWIYDTAIPALWDFETIQNIRAIGTDGESALYTPIQNLINIGGLWKGIYLYRCTFHLFTQEWRKVLCSKLSADAKKVILILETWVQTWINTLLKPYQYHDSLNKCINFLNTNRSTLGESYCKIDSILTSMQHCSSSWALCYKKHTLDLQQHTTSIGESLNSSLKNHRNSPMAALSLANSAMVCINHSDTVLERRKMVNEMENDKSRTINFGDQSLNLLTRKSQTIINELLELKSNLNCCRLDQTTWYVWDKHAFTNNKKTNDIVPRYVNVFKVQCNSLFTECWCDKSCKKMSRSGIPCEHIFKALNICHPKMIHPRYLKIYNDDTTYSDIQIKSILNDMIQWNRDNSRKCKIDGLMPANVREGFDLQHSIGNMMPELLSVIAAHKMDDDGKVLVSGAAIPSMYLDLAKKSFEGKVDEQCLSAESSENEVDPSNHDDYTSDMETTVIEHDEDRYSYNKMNSFLDTCKKELDKVLKGDPHSWPIVKQDILDVISSQTRRLNELQKNQTSSTHNIVSSNGPIERSPKGKRYRSFYERK